MFITLQSDKVRVVMSSLNIALVGFGFMGSMHAQIYAQLAGARIVGVADLRADSARAKRQRLGLASAPLRPLSLLPHAATCPSQPFIVLASTTPACWSRSWPPAKTAKFGIPCTL